MKKRNEQLYLPFENFCIHYWERIEDYFEVCANCNEIRNFLTAQPGINSKEALATYRKSIGLTT